MPRPRMRRRVGFAPKSNYFKPNGIPVRKLEQTALEISEVEAIRLCDYERMEQGKAAGKMGVSQPTFFRILKKARQKIAEAIIEGKAIKIEKKEEFQ